jgi:peptidoglycan/xylan/chitin deacetylase (PgdA/CDA1 family)
MRRFPIVLPQHDRYGLSMIDERPVYDWPRGKRLAFYIGTNLEYFAFGAGLGSDPAFKSDAKQTQRNHAWRDYGHRVGVWRLFDLLDEFGMPAAHNTSSFLYDACPQIMARARARGDEVIGHGRTQSERQGGMWEADEARMIAQATQTIAQHEGEPPRGWMGAGMSHSPVTIDLLQEAGYQYVMDWCCDDQPFWMAAGRQADPAFPDGRGRILCMPYPLEVNDSIAILFRHGGAREFADMIVDQFDEMLEQCARQPLVCAIAMHPMTVGQPFRWQLLREALAHIAHHPLRERVWYARPRDIARHVMSLPAGMVPEA